MKKGEQKAQVRERLEERKHRFQVPKEVIVNGYTGNEDCSSSSEELILRFFKSASLSSSMNSPTRNKRNDPNSPSTDTSPSASTPCNSPSVEAKHPHRPVRPQINHSNSNNDISNNNTNNNNNNNLNKSTPSPLVSKHRKPIPPPPITPRPKRSTITVYSKQPKGKAFGVPLSTLTTDPGSGVPLIVRDLVEAISRHMWTEGLFRIPGTTRTIDELRYALDHQHEHEGEDIIDGIKEPHDLASLLKLFLRELPDPLFTFELFQPLINTQSNTNPESRAECLQILLESLEKAHYLVVKFLCNFLKRVADHKDENKMTVENLAMVFAPNVIRPQNEVASTIHFDYKQARLTLEDIILHSTTIFH